jgi:SAM-dependent methyltransferase
MAKAVQVKFKVDDVWQEVEVPNFYDPEKHNNVRTSAKDKVPYAEMKMPDGMIYSKVLSKWYRDEPKGVIVAYLKVDLELPTIYANDSIQKIDCDSLHIVEDPSAMLLECKRILAPGGTLNIRVPLYNAMSAWNDIRTKRCFTQKTLTCFDSLFRQSIHRVENDFLVVLFRK